MLSARCLLHQAAATARVHRALLATLAQAAAALPRRSASQRTRPAMSGKRMSSAFLPRACSCVDMHASTVHAAALPCLCLALQTLEQGLDGCVM
jgi:hypothetical protein